MSADLWHWRAVYDDGTFLDEYDDAGQARGFLTVDQDRLTSLVLVSRDEAQLPHHVVQRCDPDSTVLFRRRRQVMASLDTGEQTPGPTVTIAGLERNGVAQYIFFFEDGSTLLSGDLEAV